MHQEPHPPPHEPAIRELTAGGAGLLWRELSLARAQLLTRARRAGAGVTMLAFAGVLGVGAWLVLLAAAIAGVEVTLPVWASALILGGALALGSGGLALLARRTRILPSLRPRPGAASDGGGQPGKGQLPALPG